MSTPTINVNLRSCTCRARSDDRSTHEQHCPALPVLLPCPIPRSVTFEVACSISGATWEDSAVDDCEMVDGRDPDDIGAAELARAVDSASNRWNIVRALVLGRVPNVSALGSMSAAMPCLVTQRDAVFSALADMARSEHAALKAQRRAELLFPYHRFHRVGYGTHEGPRPSHDILASYVEYLVEQVEVLP